MTYVLYPPRNHPELKLVGDHAYWVSRLKLREGAEQGQIDAFSHGFGVGDPEPSDTERGTGSLEGGNLGIAGLHEPEADLGRVRRSSRRPNKIEIVATGIASARIDVRRARVDCDADVEVESDGPISIVLRGCGRTVTK